MESGLESIRIYEIERKKESLFKIELMLEIGKAEAKNEENKVILQELNTMTATDILKDNGNKFNKIISPIANGVKSALEILV